MSDTPANSPLAPMELRIDATLISKLNLADFQNAVPMLRELCLVNDTPQSFSHVELVLTAEPAVLKPRSWRIDMLKANACYPIQDLDISLDGGMLGRLTEAEIATVSLALRHAGEDDAQALCHCEHKVELLPRNQWGGLSHLPDLVAAFVQPNEPAVDRVLKQAAEILRQNNKPAGINGYTEGAKRAWELSAAIWNAIVSMGLDYALPPASFEQSGQKVRSPEQIEASGLGTCLDLALLFCAALEQAGLHPLLVFTEGHAFAGVWLKAEAFSSTVVDDVTALRKRLKLNELVLFETTLVTQRPGIAFSYATERGAAQVSEEHDAGFRLAVDIHRARAQRIKPLASGHAESAHLDAAAWPEQEVLTPAIESPFALPDENLSDDLDARPLSPSSRLERWQRKLLDLSLRNNLLNFKPGKKALKLDAPDPGLLEDLLSTGQALKLRPRPDLMTGADPRDKALYEAREHQDVQRLHALEALQQREVFVAVSEIELESRLVDLFRGARTTMQEGGANTLFLALGFLSWTRDAHDERRYRAPLILIPVSLQRKSMRSGFTLTLHEDEPRFNPTLIEMLRQDFHLNLNITEGELPRDEAGLDIDAIWKSVAHAIKDIRGWEVSEDVVLSMFSFAKHLMWKDLVERTEQLRENPVVRHLLDSPRDAFVSGSPFPEEHQLDAQFAPEQVFCPLPVDSSQLAAVLAAAQGKHFVLIGPPGTGKSQTIANLIAQSLAKGRRVLFVSEKIAALDVVYRRLREIGLGEFCLELHSNKARKLDVLAQLQAAWNSRGEADAQQWQMQAQRLKQLRDALNVYVERLHARHRNGFSIFDAIGMVSHHQDVLALPLGWDATDPHDRTSMTLLRDAVDRLSVNAGALGAGSLSQHPLHPIHRGDWSPSWQQQLMAALRELSSAASRVATSAAHFLQEAQLPLVTLTPDGCQALARLAEHLPSAAGHDWRFVLRADASNLVQSLHTGCERLQQHATVNRQLSAIWSAETLAACERGLATRLEQHALQQRLSAPWSAQTMQSLEQGLAWLAELEQHHAALSVPYGDAIEHLDVAQLQQDWVIAEQESWPHTNPNSSENITQSKWSQGWLISLLAALHEIYPAAQAALLAAEEFLRVAELPSVAITMEVCRELNSLAECLPYTAGRDWRFMLQADAHVLMHHLNQGASQLRLHQKLNMQTSTPWSASLLAEYQHGLALLEEHQTIHRQLSVPWSEQTIQSVEKGLDVLDSLANHQAALSVAYNAQIEYVNIAEILQEWQQAIKTFWPMSWFGKRKIKALLAAATLNAQEPDIGNDLAHWHAIRSLRRQLQELSLDHKVSDAWKGLETKREAMQCAIRWQSSLMAAREGRSWLDKDFEQIESGQCGKTLQADLQRARRLQNITHELAQLSLLKSTSNSLWAGYGTNCELLRAALNFQVDRNKHLKQGALEHTHLSVANGSCGAVLAADYEILQQRTAIECTLAELSNLEDITSGLWRGLDSDPEEIEQASRFYHSLNNMLTHLATTEEAKRACYLSLDSLLKEASIASEKYKLVINAGFSHIKALQQLNVKYEMFDLVGAQGVPLKNELQSLSLATMIGRCLSTLNSAGCSNKIQSQIYAVILDAEGLNIDHDLRRWNSIRELRKQVLWLTLPPEASHLWQGLQTDVARVRCALRWQTALAAVKHDQAWNDLGFEPIEAGQCGAQAQADLQYARRLRQLDQDILGLAELTTLTQGVWAGGMTQCETLRAALDFMRDRQAHAQRGALAAAHASVMAGQCGAVLANDGRALQQRAQIEHALLELETLRHDTHGLWQGLDTSAEAVELACQLQAELTAALPSLASTPEAHDAWQTALTRLLGEASGQLKTGGSVAQAGADYLTALPQLYAKRQAFEAVAYLSGDGLQALNNLSPSAWVTYCQTMLAAEPDLRNWCAWQQAREQALKLRLAPLVVAIEQEQIPASQARRVFEANYARWWLNVAVDQEPIIRSFVSAEHEQRIREFRELDDAFVTLSRHVLKAHLCANLPAPESITRHSDWGVLRHEMNKKRAHLPLRELMARTSEALTQLTPCLLMSPLSIAQYLDANSALFDLVIFDEASQITVWDAIGAMARGRQVVMVGDPKQLPPSAFFDRAGTDEDDEDVEADLESILDECIGANLPTRSLNWHYRSRHESLIAFSNEKYYDSKLVTFPSPLTDDRAVSLHAIAGTYEKGGSRTNPIEARALVADLLARMSAPGFAESGLTIGVVTFNAEQQKLIEDLLDDARRADPQLERYFADSELEPVFVKNLESVQGDERDIIYFSTTFGPDAAGQLSMNFGPLNRQGGERRLNVAITRARHALRVFTSLRAEKMDLARTQAKGVHDLKHFLEFAERGVRALVEARPDHQTDADTSLEHSIAAALASRGWQVETHIGASSFRIDLAVIDPDAPGSYLAAITCDGVNYQRNATAKDRDKLREQVLQGLGWVLLRVWAMDWWLNLDATLTALDTRLREIQIDTRRQREENIAQAQAAVQLASTADDPAPACAAESHAPEKADAVKPTCTKMPTAHTEPVYADQAPSPASAAAAPLDAPSFQTADLAMSGVSLNPEAFHEASYDTTLLALIAYVVAQEGPVLDDVLARRIARAHGWMRTGARIRERITLLADQHCHTTQEGNSTFYWPASLNKRQLLVFRRPVSDEHIRPVDEISLPELTALARELRATGVQEDALLTEMARALGLQQLRAGSRARLAHACQQQST